MMQSKWMLLVCLMLCTLISLFSVSTDLTSNDYTSTNCFGIHFVKAAGKQRRTLSEKELEKIEDQWMDDEEEEDGKKEITVNKS